MGLGYVRLYSITLGGDACLANHWRSYPNQPASLNPPCLLLLKLQALALGVDTKQPVIPTHPSVHHTDEPQQERNSCLWLHHASFVWDDWGGDRWFPA